MCSSNLRDVWELAGFTSWGIPFLVLEVLENGLSSWELYWVNTVDFLAWNLRPSRYGLEGLSTTGFDSGAVMEPWTHRCLCTKKCSWMRSLSRCIWRWRNRWRKRSFSISGSSSITRWKTTFRIIRNVSFLLKICFIMKMFLLIVDAHKCFIS